MKISKSLFIVALPLAGLMLMSLLARSSGSPGGKTGSPGDGGTCTQCHSSTLEAKEGWISSDIPVDGYLAGETYTITLAAEQTGINRFGFELTAEDASGAKVGTFDIEAQSQVKLVNSNQAVTHTASGIAATDGAKSWSFKWTAPEAGTGPIGFYAAVNAANADGGTAGDEIYTTQLLVEEQIDNSIEYFLLEGWLKVYPNPARDLVRFHLNGLTPDDLEYQIFNLQGQLVARDVLRITRTNSIVSVSVSDLPGGNYVIHFSNDLVNLRGRFLIIR